MAPRGSDLDPGPLPAANYKATISVVLSGDGVMVVWSSTFDPVGDESGAAAAITGVHEAGLSALTEKF